jgi:hypothetical protein
MGPMGKLPAMGLKRTIKVFRCYSCNHIAWTEKPLVSQGFQPA